MNNLPALRARLALYIHHVAFIFFFACIGGAHAHDIPNDVRIQAYIKPAGQRLSVLVRVPMSAMREVDFPTRNGGYLDIPRADAALRNAARLWIVDNLELFEGEQRLAPAAIAGARVSLPSDRSFDSFERAAAHLEGPKLPEDMELYWSHGLLDVMLEYPILEETGDFSIHPRLSRLGLQVALALKFVPANGTMRVFELHGDPGLIRLDPRWHQAFARFVELGFMHILEGADHLLFLLCLVLPFRQVRSVVLIATAFTVGHSITLIAAALGHVPAGLWFPPFVEALIASSIVYTALENMVGYRLRRRWIVALVFGLAHGVGFSFGLQQSLQLAGGHLLASLLAFNLGIELGQLVVLAAMVPALALVFRHVANERMGTIIFSAFIAHTAWHWMIERAEVFRKYPLPAWDPAALAQVLRWLILGLVICAIIWFLAGPLRRHSRERRRDTLGKTDRP